MDKLIFIFVALSLWMFIVGFLIIWMCEAVAKDIPYIMFMVMGMFVTGISIDHLNQSSFDLFFPLFFITTFLISWIASMLGGKYAIYLKTNNKNKCRDNPGKPALNNADLKKLSDEGRRKNYPC